MDRAVVVDASVALKWVLDEPGSDAAAGLSGTRMLAPALLLVECGNALWRKGRTGALDLAGARARMAALRRAPVRLVPDESLAEMALELALELAHPVYDCLYLALAEDERVPLVTDDRRLLGTAARSPRIAALVRPLVQP
jgi:predicted nucleic acid-binding protein